MKDQADVEKFIAGHTKQNDRIGIINQMILDCLNPQTKTMLDVGCGDANYLPLFL